MHRRRAPTSRMLFVISPPPVSPVGPLCLRQDNEREKERDGEREVEKKAKGDRLLCDTRLPRIPERRLSPLPLNIHPLGKPDKNKEKARSTIPSRPSLPSKRSLEAWLVLTLAPQHVAPFLSSNLSFISGSSSYQLCFSLVRHYCHLYNRTTVSESEKKIPEFFGERGSRMLAVFNVRP